MMKTFNEYILSEGIEEVGGLRTVSNPSASQLIGMLKRSKHRFLRGYVVDQKTMYWWDGGERTHTDFARSLGLKDKKYTHNKARHAYFMESKLPGADQKIFVISCLDFNTIVIESNKSIQALNLVIPGADVDIRGFSDGGDYIVGFLR
jgi:hypothetical protein